VQTARPCEFLSLRELLPTAGIGKRLLIDGSMVPWTRPRACSVTS
jgi:hypothetical protein